MKIHCFECDLDLMDQEQVQKHNERYPDHNIDITSDQNDVFDHIIKQLQNYQKYPKLMKVKKLHYHATAHSMELKVELDQD